MTLQTGQVLNNRYRIVKQLAVGGFGTVYRAWDLLYKTPCALKENEKDTPEAQRQFAFESDLLTRLSHPNLPRVSEHFVIPGQGQYLVMEFIEGDDLETIRCRSGGVLPETQVIPWIDQVMDALAYLHSQNPPIIHRDIKPANVRITTEGKAVLVDFGIAKQLVGGITTKGAKAVSPGYSPPEQYTGTGTDQRSDVYALGATLYTLLTGMELPESVGRMVSTTETQPPHVLQAGVSKHISLAIMRSIHLKPEDRFATIAQFREVLHRTQQRSYIPFLIGIAAIFLLLILANRFIPPISRTPTATRAQTISTATDTTMVRTPSVNFPTNTLAYSSDTPSVPTSPALTSTIRPILTEQSAGKPLALPTSWATRTTNVGVDAGLFSFLIFKNNIPYISYLDDPNDRFMLTTLVNDNWYTQGLDDSHRGGWYPWMEKDSQDDIFIAYWIFEQNLQGIGYLYPSPNGWGKGPSILGVGKTKPVLAIDPNNHAYIAFLDSEDGNVKLSSLEEGSWNTKTIASAYPAGYTFDEGAAVSMMIDPNGYIHIAYPTRSSGLQYLLLKNGSGKPELVETGNALFPSLGLDSEGNPLISYYDATKRVLKLARLQSRYWSSVVVDDNGNVGKYNSMKIGLAGDIHISYYDEGKGALKYALFVNGDKKITQVDCCNVGKWTSLALDAYGLPHVSYYDSQTKHLEYAYSINGKATIVPLIATPKGQSSAATTVSSGPWKPCSFNFTSRLHLNDRGIVSTAEPYANIVRKSPYLGAAEVGKIKPGEQFQIVDGPSCADNMVWWKVVKNNSSLSGWTSEGQNRKYWLDPIK